MSSTSRCRAALIGVTLWLFAAEAQAAKLIAVLPLDITHAGGKLSPDAQASLEETLRDVAADTLGGHGWTVLATQNMLQKLRDNGIDPTKCGEGDCPLAAAREIQAEKFISGAVQWVEGDFTASIRLIDTSTGSIISTERLEGDSVKALRKSFEAKAAEFFTKGGMIGSPPRAYSPGVAPPPLAASSPTAVIVPPEPSQPVEPQQEQFTAANAVHLQLQPPNAVDHWTLRDRKDAELCGLPCEQWVGANSQFTLRGEIHQELATVAASSAPQVVNISVPGSFAFPPGTALLAKLSHRSHALGLNLWWTAFNAPVFLVGVGVGGWLTGVGLNQGEQGQNLFFVGVGLLAAAIGAAIWEGFIIADAFRPPYDLPLTPSPAPMP